MIFNPIIPIWLMAVICVGLLIIKRKGVWPYIRQILMVILLFLINLRPMFPGEQENPQGEVMNVYALFVVDDTISMVAQDYNGKEERLAGVRADCEYIVDNMPGAKFSVISFNNSSTLASPFTDNAEHIKGCVNGLYPLDGLYARGSSLNTPKEMALATLKQAKGKGNTVVAIFFISDGEITDDSKLESYKELAQYVDGGAVLGYGTSQGGNMYIQGPYDDQPELIEDTSDYPYKPAVSKIDERNLKQIAGDLGVDYIHTANIKSVDTIISDLKNKAATLPVLAAEAEEGTVNLEGAKDVYFYFAIPLFVLILYEAFVWIWRKE